MSDQRDRERLLQKVRDARAAFEAKQDDVHVARSDYYDSVRALHEGGMPLREIAETLGLSHQRVHQMINESTGSAKKAASRARAAKAGGIAIMLVLGASLFGWWVGSDEPSSTTVMPERVASTLGESGGKGGVRVEKDHPKVEGPLDLIVSCGENKNCYVIERRSPKGTFTIQWHPRKEYKVEYIIAPAKH